ncbi:MAG TPA: hypothetical protein VKX41_18395 [Alloacidobacterium sp.]|nr:hypothetical protein [Alloacidobacterium sp.]
MRRALSIWLLWLFSFSLIWPIFAPNATAANLPLCCRRMGSHHCGVPSDGTGAARSIRISIIAEKCPCGSAAPAAFHLTILAPPSSGAGFAEIVSHPAIHAQTLAQYRISFDRSRQKRGPPADFLV